MSWGNEREMGVVLYRLRTTQSQTIVGQSVGRNYHTISFGYPNNYVYCWTCGDSSSSQETLQQKRVVME